MFNNKELNKKLKEAYRKFYKKSLFKKPIPKKPKAFNPRRTKEYRKWRRRTLQMFNYTCAHCGSKEDLEVHHQKMWKDYKHLRTDLDNGEVVCKSCHSRIHPWLTIK